MRKLALATITAMLVVGLTTPAAMAVKIGAVFSLTGPYSALGDPEKKTAEMVAETVNKAGGINGEPIELIIYDDETNATKCNLMVKKLITQDKVTAIIGPTGSGASLAVLPLAQKHKIPIISCAASYKIVMNDKTGKPYPWVFKTPQTDSMAAKAIFTHMKKHGIVKIAIMSDTGAFGSGGRSEVLRLAPEFGIEVIADEKYGPKDSDMITQLTKIKSHAPQAILNWSAGSSTVTVVRNWKSLSMDSVPLYQSHGFGSRKYIKLAAGTAEGVFCPLGACNVAEALPENHPQKKVTMAYHKAYTSKYNEPLSSFGGHAWDAMYLLIDAIKAVGTDKKAIRDYLETKTGFVGQHGIFNFSANDHNGLTKDAFQMVVVKGGDWALSD